MKTRCTQSKTRFRLWVFVVTAAWFSGLVYASNEAHGQSLTVRIQGKDGKEKVIEVADGGMIRIEKANGQLVAQFPVLAKPSAKSKPSEDPSTPTPLKIREVVQARLGNSDVTGKFHYWSVDLPAGDYQFVIDLQRADEVHSNIGGELLWMSSDGEKLGRLGFINAVDHRWRSLFSVDLKKPFKGIIRLANQFTISDYHFGVFSASDSIPAPFFNNGCTVKSLKLDEKTTAQLNGGNTTQRDIYYRMRLPAGDDKVSANFRRSDKKKGNVGGTVNVFGANGELRARPIFVNDVDFSSKAVRKLPLAEEETLLFRVRANNAEEAVEFHVEKW